MLHGVAHRVAYDAVLGKAQGTELRQEYGALVGNLNLLDAKLHADRVWSTELETESLVKSTPRRVG